MVPPKRPPRGRGRGREEWGGKVTFHTPKGVSVERLRLRAGDSVVLSETSPLVDAASEGQVVLVSDSLIAVTLLAQPPEGLAARTWRVDKGSNRTSYLRQLDSLVKLCAPRGQGLPQDLAARGRGSRRRAGARTPQNFRSHNDGGGRRGRRVGAGWLRKREQISWRQGCCRNVASARGAPAPAPAKSGP